jgi:lysozyme family protein
MNPTEAHLIKRTLAEEGGYVDHPSDHGGPTNYGITAATLGAWRKLGREASADEVKALPRDEAREIYLRQWVRHPKLNLYLIHDIHVAWWAMDTSVLFGLSRRLAARWMQEAAGVSVDGFIGPASIAAINSTSRTRMLITCTKLRMRRHAQIVEDQPSQVAFIKGWVARALSHLDVLAA